MTHKALRKLKPMDGFPDVMVGTTTTPCGRISVTIVPDGTDKDDNLTFTAEALDELFEIDESARQAAARALLDTYNEGWRLSSHPELTAGEFVGRLTLVGLEVERASECSLSFDTADMFGTHRILVKSKNPTTFEDPTVHLSG